MNAVVENVLGGFLMVAFMGAITAVLLTVLWKVLRIAAISFVIGCGVFYVGALYMMIFQSSYYWGELAKGDMEAVGLTAYVVLVTLGGLGYLIWSNRDIITSKSAQSKQTTQSSYNSHQNQEQTYQEPPRFQQPGDLRLRDLELLGLERSANDDEIKAAYRQLSKKYHPDLNPDPHATIIFKQIQKAYTNLIN